MGQSMKRREALRGLGASAVAAAAGCTAVPRGGDGTTPTPETETPTERPTGPSGIDLPVPESELQRGAPKDGIPAITEPAFGEDWTGVSLRVVSRFTGQERTIEPRLTDADEVVGVERDGKARAYPLAVLNWHEVVNDTFGGPLLVTYCPLCGSAVVAERRVRGEETQFGVSGLLYRQDLVMYDEATESLWSQILATAIRGPATGDRLSVQPSSLTTWGSWREDHPETRVLRPPPESKTVGGALVRNYNTDPYAGYAESRRIGLGGSFEDDRLHPKTTVLGIVEGDEATAYPLPAVEEAGVVNDVVGGRPVVVAAASDGTLSAHDRRLDGRTLEFAAADDRHMSAEGSRFERTTGRAVDGPLAGARLTPVAGAETLFWFAWLGFYPDTEVFGTGD